MEENKNQETLIPPNNGIPDRFANNLDFFENQELFNGRNKDGSFYNAPFPPPNFLLAYKAVDQNFPERLMAFAEREQEDRHEVGRIVLKNHFEKIKRGQNYALGFGILILACAVGLAVSGLTATSVALSISGIGGLAFTFLTGKRKKPKIPTGNLK